MSTKPNIVVLIADDLGYGDVSMNGSEILHTPHIDAIAERGIRFTNFHSNGAVCSPTRAAFLTGCYQQRSGITGVLSAANHREKGLDPERFTSMASLLKQADYRTALFGKWHVGYDTKYNPTAHGFDLFKGFVSGNVDYQSHVDQTGVLDWWNGDGIQNEPGYTTDLITRYGVQFIEDSQDTPFFLTLAHECPHYPYRGPNDIEDREPGVCPERNLIHGSRVDKEGAYVEMMQSMDQGIGEVVAALERTGQLENTLVFFFSDNGPAGIGSSGPLRGGKGSLYEGGHRIPAAAMWPGVIPEGQTVDETILAMDIFATAASITGVGLNTKQNVDGVN